MTVFLSKEGKKTSCNKYKKQMKKIIAEHHLMFTLANLSYHDGDAKDNVDQEIDLYFYLRILRNSKVT